MAPDNTIENDLIIGIMDILMILIFEICFPTADVYFDLLLAYKLFHPKCYQTITGLMYFSMHGYLRYGKTRNMDLESENQGW